MFKPICFRPEFFLVLVLLASATRGDVIESPRITAQGFKISVTQEGRLHNFGQLRVRFEAPQGIEELYIKERSYEVDLAKTPDASHFPLFGLKTQVRRMVDVTLDFENYINSKIDSDGNYVFEVRLTDRKGKTVSSQVVFRVTSPSTVSGKSEDKVVGLDQFFFKRVGKSEATGADIFGITWKTVKSDDVTIEIFGTGKESTKLVEVKPLSYTMVKTQDQLDQAISLGKELPFLRLAAANDKAAGSIFGVVNREKKYLLKVTSSQATVSVVGTTVTLIGEYKH